MSDRRSRQRDADDEGDEISEAESDRFIVKIAQYLQGFIGEKGWSEEMVRKAFDDSVENMPNGRARLALRARFDEFADKLCDTIYRRNWPSIELSKEERKIEKWRKDPTTEWWALEQPPLEKF